MCASILEIGWIKLFVQQLAAKFGVPTDQVLKLLAEHLPAAVDQASPDGKLKS